MTALLGVEQSELVKTLTVRTIVARDDTYEKKLTPTQAVDARDALSKAIYGRLFDWIVRTINLSIQVPDAAQIRANIGVLDIFGFECFVQNSFEQLCINYTNETLQQQFNQYIFKMEQVEYQAERIEWSFIEFPDNQDCLDLIENKVNGILAMIDDECRLPSSSVRGLTILTSFEMADLKIVFNIRMSDWRQECTKLSSRTVDFSLTLLKREITSSA